MCHFEWWISPDLKLGVGFQDHMLPACLVFKETLALFHSGFTSYIPTKAVRSPLQDPFSAHPLQRLFFVDLLNDGHCDQCEETPHCNCDWHGLNNYWCGVCFHVFLLFFCYVLLLFVTVHFVSTIYFLNLPSWTLALYGILFRQFSPGRFLRAGVIDSPLRLVTVKIPSARFLWYIY